MSVFNSLYAGQYDQLYAEKNYLNECDLIEAAVKRHANYAVDTIVDIGCGTGGHSIELARRGYKVTGVDLSQSMIEHANQKSALLRAEQHPIWLCGDARDFDAETTFDLGIMMFAVIGYLTTNEDLLKGLRNIRRQLKPGALFVCDFWYGPSVLSAKPADRVRTLSTEDGNIIRASSTTLDVAHHTADVTFKLWTLKGDRLTGESTETHRLRYFFPQEFALLLSQAGFSLQSMSGFPTLDNPLTEQTWSAFVVAKVG
jgi:SAM-dependent methyltransferase